MKRKIITICSSAAFYGQIFEIEVELKKLGFSVKLPYTALRMKKSGDFRVATYKTWFKNSKDYTRKAWLMKNHFKKIVQSDAVLILNYEKNGFKGYIGGNFLIEMAIAFQYKKPIYILNDVSKKNKLSGRNFWHGADFF